MVNSRRSEYRQNQLRTLEARRIKAQAVFNEAQDIIALKEMSGWKRIQDRLQAKLRDKESALRNFRTLTDSENKVLQAEKEMLEAILNIAGDFETDLGRLAQVIAELDDAIERAKAGPPARS